MRLTAYIMAEIEKNVNIHGMFISKPHLSRRGGASLNQDEGGHRAKALASSARAWGWRDSRIHIIRAMAVFVRLHNNQMEKPYESLWKLRKGDPSLAS